jgi:hypothetical protein
VQTPLERLANLLDIDERLKLGITITQLQQQAMQMSDLQSAEALNAARIKLFAIIVKRSRHAD